MPIYEYKCENCGIIEIMHSIKDDAWTKCPQCSQDGLKRLISLSAGFIDKNRQSNQYNDIKVAKYWRDKNGDRHRVTAADGSLSSPTVSSKVTASPEEIKAKKKKEEKIKSVQRQRESYQRYVKNINELPDFSKK